jgi:hypothetical protein
LINKHDNLYKIVLYKQILFQYSSSQYQKTLQGTLFFDQRIISFTSNTSITLPHPRKHQASFSSASIPASMANAKQAFLRERDWFAENRPPKMGWL